MLFKVNKYLSAALILGLAFNASAMFFTLDNTYDALIHLFFGEHYANNWFESWNYKWYTGFTVTSYPPLVHQLIGLLSFIGGLKFGLYVLTTIIIFLFITGVYRFSLIFVKSKDIAGLSALLAVFSSSFLETLHIFGQLPSLMGISLLMHALPEIYNWLFYGKFKFLIRSISLIAVTVTSHHVTPIFGMVFFIFPLMGLVVLDVAKQDCESYKDINIQLFIKKLFFLLKRIIAFGFTSLVLIVVCILPYWVNTKANPITQVPIPHGSRDHFLEVTSSGLVFFFIPWGALLLILPYFFIRFFNKRFLFFGLSFSMLVLLGTGGTTPIPRKILGENAFNILTLDRFTLWATIMSLPLLGEFAYRFFLGDLGTYFRQKIGVIGYKLMGITLNTSFLAMIIFTMSLGFFRPSQPPKINMLPLVNFLNQDQHYKWRYLTLGFGDQMALLAANTKALSVDGNYHSARRLPELTSRPIERLENSKFKGVAGIGSLQQFLTVPEKYNLKYIFSNDKFYDPILHFCGWEKLPQLENGITVWEKVGVPPLDSILPKTKIPKFLEIMWGIIPLLVLSLAVFIFSITSGLKKSISQNEFENNFSTNEKLGKYQILPFFNVLTLMVICGFIYTYYLNNASHKSPKNIVKAYYDAIDFKNFEESFSFIDPLSELSIDQYMLEIAVNDGILSSYAKLDEIKTTILSSTKKRASLNVTTKWITPLETITKEELIEVILRGNKWYILREKASVDLPPNQLISSALPKYYNQGRRKISSEQTYHEDILRQPIVEVITGKLVKFNNRYSVIGELQNIDNVPADVSITAILYDDSSNELASFNAKYNLKHKLMPKETTAFRIDFERIAWSNIKDTITSSFDPDEFTAADIKTKPTQFVLQVSSNVSTANQYKDASIFEYSINESTVTGTVFNSGIQEVTIPQLFLSYYNANNELLWVDTQAIINSVRPERKQPFTAKLRTLKDLEILSTYIDKCYINGLPNKNLASKIVFNRENSFVNYDLIPLKDGATFLKLELNNYVGIYK